MLEVVVEPAWKALFVGPPVELRRRLANGRRLVFGGMEPRRWTRLGGGEFRVYIIVVANHDVGGQSQTGEDLSYRAEIIASAVLRQIASVEAEFDGFMRFD